MVESYKKFAGGVDNAGGLLPLEGGFKYQQITLNPVDAQMLENRSFNVEDICRWFKVPPFMVGHTEKSTSWGSGLEQQNTGVATYTLRPYLRRIELKGQAKLLSPYEQNKYMIEFNLDALLRADAKNRAAYWTSALQNGWMSRNDVRSKENLPPVEGGDELTIQLNLMPLNRLGKEQANETGNQKPGV
jgi:HK97 family phage portal protein